MVHVHYSTTVLCITIFMTQYDCCGGQYFYDSYKIQHNSNNLQVEWTPRHSPTFGQRVFLCLIRDTALGTTCHKNYISWICVAASTWSNLWSSIEGMQIMNVTPANYMDRGSHPMFRGHLITSHILDSVIKYQSLDTIGWLTSRPFHPVFYVMGSKGHRQQVDKMAAFSQTIFWDAFSGMKSFVFCEQKFIDVCS